MELKEILLDLTGKCIVSGKSKVILRKLFVAVSVFVYFARSSFPFHCFVPSPYCCDFICPLLSPFLCRLTVPTVSRRSVSVNSVCVAYQALTLYEEVCGHALASP